MRHPGGISTVTRLNPPVAQVAEDYVELSIAITVKGDHVDTLDACPAEVVGVLVGSATAEVVEGMDSALKIQFLDADGGLKSAAQINEPSTTLSEALTRFVSWVDASGKQNAHLFLFVSKATIENGEHRCGAR